MAKKAEEFEAAENLRTKVLQLEKRFVEAELAVNQIRDFVDKAGVGTVPDLAQRLGDVEDLMMVENVGVTELKSMLIDLQGRLKMKVPPEFEEKVKDIESRLAETESGLEALKLVPELKEKTGRIEARLLDAERGLEAMPSPQEIISPPWLEKMQRDMHTLSGEMSVLRGKFEVMKSSAVDELRGALEPRMKDLENELGVVREKANIFYVPENLAKDVEEIKNDFAVAKAQVDAVERIVQNFAAEVQTIRQTAKKFESFDKITNLKGELEGKLEEMRVVQESANRLSSRIKTLYSDIDKRLDIIKRLETSLPRIEKSISDLNREVERSKVELAGAVKGRDLDQLVKADIEKFGAVDSSLNGLKESLRSSTASLHDSAAKLDRRLAMLEETQGEVMKSMERLGDASRLDKIDKRIGSLESTVDGVKDGLKVLGELKEKPGEARLETDKLGTRIAELAEKKTLDSIAPIIDRKLAELQEPTAVLTSEVSELVDRVVFLESRLGAIEAELEKKLKAQPIILE